MRAVLDPNVLIAALLSRQGAPARLLSHWLAGAFELVVSESLLVELERALGYPKLRSRIPSEEAEAFISLLRDNATLTHDSAVREHRSVDPNDDYLLALAASSQAVIVTGDQHLLELARELPIQTARGFLEAIEC